MTVSEFKNEFLIHYNAIATNSAPSLDDYEISVYLTKAQLELVKTYSNPEGNKYKEGFEASEKRRVDLKELTKHYVATAYSGEPEGISTDSKFIKIPDDVFLIRYESIEVISADCNNGIVISVYPKTLDEYNIQKDNPFKRPSNKIAWRLDYSMIDTDKVVEIITPYEISKYNLRYTRYPNPIILSDLTIFAEGLSIDGFTASQTSELSAEIHREILDRAVELALRDYKPSGLESKIQLDSRNE